MRILIVLAMLMLAVVGCGPLWTGKAALTYEQNGNNNDSPAILEDAHFLTIARQFGFMAHLASVVYRDDISDADRDADQSDSDELSAFRQCRYVGATSADNFGLPEVPDEEGRRWYRWSGDGSVFPCLNHASGLYYETIVFGDPAQADRIEQAVLVFRGTDGKSDWSTNFAAVFGLEPRQYAVARKTIPSLIDALMGLGAPAIFAAGHSLGGGLAQQAGYLSKQVEQVYAFNTTPVTNWTSLALDGAVAVRYPTVHRISHGGEILRPLRSAATAFTSARYNRHDLDVQLYPREPFSGHGIEVLSCAMAYSLLAAERGESGESGESGENGEPSRRTSAEQNPQLGEGELEKHKTQFYYPDSFIAEKLLLSNNDPKGSSFCSEKIVNWLVSIG